jgi:hypothetical protein
MTALNVIKKWAMAMIASVAFFIYWFTGNDDDWPNGGGYA